MPSYTFPEDIRISDNAKEVISSLLVNDPGTFTIPGDVAM